MELEVGYERVTTRRALEVLMCADVFKLPEQEIFLSHTHTRADITKAIEFLSMSISISRLFTLYMEIISQIFWQL